MWGRSEYRGIGAATTPILVISQGDSGYSSQAGSFVESQLQSSREPQKMWAVGLISGLLSKVPVGITAMLRSGAQRGNGPPQFLQKTVRNRFASGTLKLPIASSPAVHAAASGLRMTLLAWPVPVDFRQRWQ